jgi:hypothetical protein
MVFAIALLSLFSLLLAGCLGDDKSFQEEYQDFCTNASAEEQQTGLYQNNCLVAADNSAASDTNTSSGTTSNGGATSGQGTTGNSGTDTTGNGTTGSNAETTGNSGTGTDTAPAPAYTGNVVCKGIWANKANEIDGAGRQRIEVGGGGVQHVDFYPDRGIPSVSYIFAPQDPIEWFGFGSIMEWNGNECDDYDYVADAMHYASDAPIDGRQDSGHSGIVVDTRDGTIYNAGTWTDQEVSQFLAAVEAVRTNKDADLSSFTQYVRTNAEGEAQGCPESQHTTYKDAANVTVTGPAIVTPWGTEGGWGDTQLKIMVTETDGTVTFMNMKGESFQYQNSPACNASLQMEYDNTDRVHTPLQEVLDSGKAKSGK